ncbi:class I SAM-dependent methyltransferase [Opitutales bacterium]|nr:class I SAM-dependent methyltransferase [Opitutales bacterium]
MEDFLQKKQIKLRKIEEIISPTKDYIKNKNNFDFLPNSLRKEYDLKTTENISAHGYDRFARELIEKNREGLILDCGSGKRPEYLDNVVNFEIVPYETTDVLGIGEKLPFKDNCFDAVLSLNVLEHVRDPFKCAAEISRVLKPEGKLYCVVPLMCPYHDFPDHYYNMTHSGLKNLFEEFLEIDNQDIIASGLPIFSLTWILNSWANGLDEDTRKSFLSMSVQELLADPVQYLDRPFVKNLSKEKNFELAATTALWATKSNTNNSKNYLPLFLQKRAEIYKLLHGKGIEIGPFEHPAKLPDQCSVEYCDVISTEEAKDLFPEVDHQNLVEIDHIIDLDQNGLSKFENEKFDFVIINHVIEHLFNPIDAIINCFRVLKKGGIMVIAIPDKKYTFDKERPLTTIESINERLNREKQHPIPSDYEDMITFIHKKLINVSETEKKKALDGFLRRREHLNIWTDESFFELLDFTIKYYDLNVEFITRSSSKVNNFEHCSAWKKI